MALRAVYSTVILLTMLVALAEETDESLIPWMKMTRAARLAIMLLDHSRLFGR